MKRKKKNNKTREIYGYLRDSFIANVSLRISHGASLVTSRESGIDCFSRTPMKNEGKERKHSGARVLPVSKQDKHVATNFPSTFLPSFLPVYSHYTRSYTIPSFTIPSIDSNVLTLEHDVAKTPTPCSNPIHP